MWKKGGSGKLKVKLPAAIRVWLIGYGVWEKIPNPNVKIPIKSKFPNLMRK